MLTPKNLLRDLGFSNAEADILLSILKGTEGVSGLQKQTGLKRPTVYYVLQRLMQKGILAQSGRTRGGRLQASLPALSHLAEERAKSAQQQQTKVSEWLELLKSEEKGAGEKPAVAFYEGVAAVRRIVMETLYIKSRHVDVLAPTKNFFHELGTEYVKTYIGERNARGISTRSLWENPVDQATLKKFYTEKSSIRILPQEMKNRFQTTMFIYDDKVLYVSSLRNAYALQIVSKEHRDFLTAIFDALWVISNPVTGHRDSGRNQ